MMKPYHPVRSKRGFTLIELILGMTIMAMVIVSAYSMLDTAMTAYRNGIQSMEVYQAARIGLRRVADELRFSLSQDAFWTPPLRYELVPKEQFLMTSTLPFIQERDPGKIIFKGAENEVVFTRKIYQLGAKLPFDLQLCKIHVNPESQQLLLTVMKSLLMIKQAAWWYAIQFNTGLDSFAFAFEQTADVQYRLINNPEMPLMPMEEYIGDYGVINKSYLIAEHVKSIHFRYADSDRFQTDWDSDEIVREYRISVQSPNFNAATDTRVDTKGPPLVVEIKLELKNGETLLTSTDIPAGNMTNLGGGARPQSGAPAAIGSGAPAPGAYSETQFNVPSVSPGR